MNIDGKKSSVIIEILCGYIRGSSEDNPEVSANGSIENNALSTITSLSCDTSETEIENIRLGQLLNSEAIQALSTSVAQLASLISQFEIPSNKGNRDAILENESGITKELHVFEYGNNGNDDDPIVTNEATYHRKTVENNGEEIAYSLDSDSDENATVLNDTNVLKLPNQEDSFQHVIKKLTPTTYAKVVASHFAANSADQITTDKEYKTKPTSVKPPRKNNEGLDGFIAVERKRNKSKKFFISGIAENVTQTQIVSYLEQRSITPTYISVFASHRKGTLSCKIHIPSASSSLVLEENFWPKHVKCKPWQEHKKTKQKVCRTLDGNVSTYV